MGRAGSRFGPAALCLCRCTCGTGNGSNTGLCLIICRNSRPMLGIAWKDQLGDFVIIIIKSGLIKTKDI